jgi:hypothetical protein
MEKGKDSVHIIFVFSAFIEMGKMKESRQSELKPSIVPSNGKLGTTSIIIFDGLVTNNEITSFTTRQK